MYWLKQIITWLKNLIKKTNTDSQQNQDQSVETLPIAEELAPTPFHVAKTQIGVAEKTHDAIIEKYHSAAGLSAGSNISWCSSFLIWCFNRANLTTPADAWASSWRKYGIKTNKPKQGDIVLMSGSGGSGVHVGFYVSESEFYIKILSGNDQNKVQIRDWPRYKLLEYRTENV